MKKKSVCLIPEAASLGGPRTFQRHLISWAERQDDFEIHFDADRDNVDAFLVIGGPKKYLKLLLKAKHRGIPVVHRLNGMNWIHRKRKCGLRYFLHSEAANFAIAFFRRFVCSKIVYQSPYCEQRWNRTFGKLTKPSRVIYNGTDLDLFHPGENRLDLSDRIDFLLVEGSFRHGMDFGLDAAAELALQLSDRLGKQVCMHVAGKTTEEAETRIQKLLKAGNEKTSVIFEGVIGRDELIALEQRMAFFFSSEIHAACPNAVIEALACGLPVIGYDTGALKDVAGNGGIIVPYGTNPWKLEKPQILPLADAAEQIIRENPSFRQAARARAESVFSADRMAESYMRFLFE